MNPSTLKIEISEKDRDLIQADTGVPYVTSEIEIRWNDSPDTSYLCVRNMQGLDDSDIKGYITELAKRESETAVSSIAKRILAIANGFVSFHTPHLPGHTRLYRDG